MKPQPCGCQITRRDTYADNDIFYDYDIDYCDVHAAAPKLREIVDTLLAAWDCDEDDDAKHEDLLDQAVGKARRLSRRLDNDDDIG